MGTHARDPEGERIRRQGHLTEKQVCASEHNIQCEQGQTPGFFGK